MAWLACGGEFIPRLSSKLILLMFAPYMSLVGVVKKLVLFLGAGGGVDVG